MEIDLPTILEHPAPDLLGYSQESAIAEKFDAMLTLGSLNSRMKGAPMPDSFHDVVEHMAMFLMPIIAALRTKGMIPNQWRASGPLDLVVAFFLWCFILCLASSCNPCLLLVCI